MLTNERIAEMRQAELNMVALTGASEAIRGMASEYAEALEELLMRRNAPVVCRQSPDVTAEMIDTWPLRIVDRLTVPADYTVSQPEPEPVPMGPISQADGDSDIWGTGDKS